MPLWMWLVLAALAWCVVALVLGLVIGRVIRRRRVDDTEPVRHRQNESSH